MEYKKILEMGLYTLTGISIIPKVVDTTGTHPSTHAHTHTNRHTSLHSPIGKSQACLSYLTLLLELVEKNSNEMYFAENSNEMYFAENSDETYFAKSSGEMYFAENSVQMYFDELLTITSSN